MGADAGALRTGLERHRRIWRWGLWACLKMRLLGLGLVGLAFYGLLDRFLALSVTARYGINTVGLLALVGLGLHQWLRIARLSPRDTAERLDRRRADRRGTLLGAYELTGADVPPASASGGLNAFLVGRSVGQACQALTQTRLLLSLPRNELRQRARVLGLQAAAVLLLVALNPLAAGIILARLLRPGEDAPPYSRLTFDVRPALATVTYGGALELRARIGGGPLPGPVWLLTRESQSRGRTACFQEGPGRFAQRLEPVVTPLEFCFATGKARSAWHRVEVLMQPRIALAVVVVTPPAYSRRLPDRFYVGAKPLQGLRGSQVELTLTSNRPLLDGTATLQPRRPGASAPTVAGRLVDAQTLSFVWPIEGHADVSVTVRDVRGTPGAAPFRLVQQELPDAPPSVALHQPEAFSMATPNAVVTIAGEASDDLGLRSVELVQALVGYRDRIRHLGPALPASRFGIDQPLDLAALGVIPGETLEFYAEAQDTHPGMAGISASDIARIQIISEEDYAAMLRTKITMAEFLGRYQAAQGALDGFREALKALTAPGTTRDETTARLEHAVQRGEAAQQLLNQLARDFAVYDIEKGLGGDLATLAAEVGKAQEALRLTDADNTRLSELAQHWWEALTPGADALTQRREKAEAVSRVATLMEAAVRFRQLVVQQESLVRSLARYELEPVADGGRRLRTLATRQTEIQSALNDILETIAREVPNLPPEASPFGVTAEAFAQRLKDGGVTDLMGAAAVAAENADGREAHHQARLALERLKEKRQECNKDGGFGEMCNGEGAPRFGDADQQATLEQMLAAMTMRLLGARGGEGPEPGQSTGSSGMGLGGDASDGYWMFGNTPLNVPMLGPARTRFTPTASGVKSAAGGGGAGGAAQASGESESLRTQPGSTVDSRSLPIEDVPLKYREAVKQYFATED